MQIRLAIIICNFNKSAYLRQCLESVFASRGLEFEHQVIVVDNASTDDSVSLIKTDFPQVVLLENQHNEGGSGGFARGMEYAANQQFSHIALLDNDIRLESETLISLFEYLRHNPSVGVVGSKILSMDNPQYLQELGSYIDWENFAVRVEFKGAQDSPELPAVTVCDYVPACCLMTRLEVLQQVGSFDRRHFIYWDDMDWCWRVKQAGYQIHAISQARVCHKMGAQNLATTFASYYFERNRVLFFLKHLPEDRIAAFIQHWAERCCNTLFFCQFKQTPNLALSLLFAYEDVLSDQLYRQDGHVLPREQDALFSQFVGTGPVYIVNSEHTGLVHQCISYLNTQQVQCVLIKPDGSQSLATALQDLPQVAASAVPADAPRLILHRHVSTAIPALNAMPDLYHADPYGHLVADQHLSAFLQQYQNFQRMFRQILQPVWQERFVSARQRYRQSQATPGMLAAAQQEQSRHG